MMASSPGTQPIGPSVNNLEEKRHPWSDPTIGGTSAMKRFVAMLLAGLLALSAVTAASADNPPNSNNNNGPPPCQGQANPGCSGPGGS